MENKMLPIEIPWSYTYLTPASEFAVMQSYENTRNRILNRFIQVKIFEDIISGDNYDVGLSMVMESFCECPHLYSTLISSKFMFTVDNLIDFIILCIDNESYVYVHRYINEFYLSSSPYYQKYEMLHMFIFYGYDKNKRVFYTLGYNNNMIFSKLEIPFSELEQSIDNNEDKDGKYILLIRHNNENNEEINTYDIKYWLDQYLNNKNSNVAIYGVNNEKAMSEKLVYGIKTYDYLNAYLYYAISGFLEYDRIDNRFCRQLYEHKMIMMKRINAMSSLEYIDSMFENKYKSVLDSSNILCNMQTKFNLTKNINILKRMQERIKLISNDEFAILDKLYNSI